MLICRSVEVVPCSDGYKTDAVGFIRYFATKDEARIRARRFKLMKYEAAAVEVFAQVFDTKKKRWII